MTSRPQKSPQDADVGKTLRRDCAHEEGSDASRVKRVLEMIQASQMGRELNVSELAAKYKVTERTIRRDVQLLRNAGLVEGGRQGLSTRSPPQRAPISSPTLDELISLTIAANLEGEALSPAQRQRLQGILEKVLVAESVDIRQPIHELASLLQLTPHEPAVARRLTLLPLIYEGIVRHRTLRVWWRNGQAEVASVLLVPTGIIISGLRWSLVGYLLGESKSPPIDFDTIDRLEWAEEK